VDTRKDKEMELEVLSADIKSWEGEVKDHPYNFIVQYVNYVAQVYLIVNLFFIFFFI